VLDILTLNMRVFDYMVRKDKTWRIWIEMMKEIISDFIKEEFYWAFFIRQNHKKYYINSNNICF
jgi:hypothetical protein